ncbi:hypothetical protein V8U11_14760 [Pseudomonas chlororaphis]|uniref:hypothetical protein n=1 Tax=Pseudomonas chlororaphis TaxID=587753 RepID=UPI0030CC71C8
MFSYSFAVKLTDRKIDLASAEALFESGDRTIRVERKEDDVLLISSDGYSCKEDAVQQIASMIMKAKITLLKLRVPHLDWLSLNSTQRFATETIGNIFEERKIVAVSYIPKVYKTERFQHWPGAALAGKTLKLDDLVNISLPDAEFNFVTTRTLEALNVLGLALADPHAKSKLILAMTAVEILSDRGRVEKDIVDALDLLKKKIPEIQVTVEVRSQLSMILGQAKKESISKAGKRLVEHVLGSDKAEYFDTLYKVRSELVHGSASRLSTNVDQQAEIEQLAEDGFQLALELTLAFQEPVTSAT